MKIDLVRPAIDCREGLATKPSMACWPTMIQVPEFITMWLEPYRELSDIGVLMRQ